MHGLASCFFDLLSQSDLRRCQHRSPRALGWALRLPCHRKGTHLSRILSRWRVRSQRRCGASRAGRFESCTIPWLAAGRVEWRLSGLQSGALLCWLLRPEGVASPLSPSQARGRDPAGFVLGPPWSVYCLPVACAVDMAADPSHGLRRLTPQAMRGLAQCGDTALLPLLHGFESFCLARA